MERLEAYVDWVLSAATPERDLTDAELLADRIGRVGLFHDARCSPQDAAKSLYGDDAAYMLPSGTPGGLWQTPSQLAAFLVHVSTRRVRTYVDVGTFTGWTITVVAAYLTRFGLERVVTYDANRFAPDAVRDLWASRALPIEYVVLEPGALGAPEAHLPMAPPYDLVFIDGDHDRGVHADFERFKRAARIVCFHDVVDAFCPEVRRVWADARRLHGHEADLFEFTQHPNGFQLMGIGLLEWHQQPHEA
jgi:hypothetical protein